MGRQVLFYRGQNRLLNSSLNSSVTLLLVFNITPFPFSFYTSRATFGATLKTKKPVSVETGFKWWCLQEEFTLFHLILKTPKSLIINDITSFLL